MATTSRSNSRRAARRIFRAGDVILVAVSFSLAQALISGEEFRLDLQVDALRSIGSLALVGGVVAAYLAVGDLLELNSFTERLRQTSLALGVGFLLEAFLSYAGLDSLSAYMMLAGSAICAVLLTAWYWIFGLRFQGGGMPTETLIVDPDPTLAAMAHSPRFLSGRLRMFAPLSDQEGLRDTIEKYHAGRIVVPDEGRELPTSLLLELRSSGVVIENAAEFYESALERVSTRHLRPSRVLFGELAPKRRNLAIQAIYSNVAVLAVLIVAFPLLLLIMIALKVTAPTLPVLDTRLCAGFNRVPFTLLRFGSRSFLGRWLDRFGLAGLPQLLNVVRGEMSLVGPRPERVEFTQELIRHIPYYAERLAVRPGLTGWAQIHSPGRDTVLELEYDLYYMANLSPGFDLSVLLRSLAFPRRDKVAADPD